jgi:hypothetical protein
MENRLSRRELYDLVWSKPMREKQARIQGLLQEAKNWRRAADIREYVNAVRATASMGNMELQASDIENWATWPCFRRT